MKQTIYEYSSLLRSGAMKAEEAVQLILDDIAANNDTDHIFITVSREIALQQAAACDREFRDGKSGNILRGIPYTLKDMFKTAGVRTTGGSRVLEDYIPDENAAIVDILNDNGAVMLGKVNQYEFAHGATSFNPYYGDVCNPYDSTRVAGGSSSGSAAAVAKGYGLFSIGTDTGGSVRVPAALCGLVGFKPTYGALPSDGMIPYCWSLDHPGIIANTAKDTRIVFEVLNGMDTSESDTINLKGIRIGIPEHFFYDDLDPEISAAMEDVFERYRNLGAELVSVTLPDLSDSRTASLVIQLPEILSSHSTYLKDRSNLYSEELKAGMAAGQFILAEQYLTAKRVANYYKNEISKVFSQVDLLLTPSTPCLAPTFEQTNVRIGEVEMPAGNAVTRFFSIFNMTGMPAVTVPSGFSSSGLPIGHQLIAAIGQDVFLMRTAEAFEDI